MPAASSPSRTDPRCKRGALLARRAQAVAVVSGRGEFFGRADDPSPSGRWQRVEADGFFPAAIRYGLHDEERRAACCWQAKPRYGSRQRGIFGAGSWSGRRLALGDPVLRYDPGSATLDFLTPPPRQARTRSTHYRGTADWSLVVEHRPQGLFGDCRSHGVSAARGTTQKSFRRRELGEWLNAFSIPFRREARPSRPPQRVSTSGRRRAARRD